MNITELIVAARSTVIDEKKLQDLEDRIQLAEEKFEKQAQSRSVNKKFLDRIYDI